jgi:hypothetical protein
MRVEIGDLDMIAVTFDHFAANDWMSEHQSYGSLFDGHVDRPANVSPAVGYSSPLTLQDPTSPPETRSTPPAK